MIFINLKLCTNTFLADFKFYPQSVKILSPNVKISCQSHSEGQNKVGFIMQ